MTTPTIARPSCRPSIPFEPSPLVFEPFSLAPGLYSLPYRGKRYVLMLWHPDQVKPGDEMPAGLVRMPTGHIATLIPDPAD